MKTEIDIDFLKQVLKEMEDMWWQIDSEWASTVVSTGGLEQSIADGKEPVIKELRRIIEAS